MRIRVTGKPKADVNMPNQAMLDQVVNSGRQALQAESSAKGASEKNKVKTGAQSSLPRPRHASEAHQDISSFAVSYHPAADADMHQATHTPLHSYSQAFQHGYALTGGTWTGTGSPLPHRFFSEGPPLQPRQHATADYTLDCGGSTSVSHAQEASSSHAPSHVGRVFVLADTAVDRGARLLPGTRQAQEMPGARSQGQPAAAPEPCFAMGGEIQQKLSGSGRGEKEEEERSGCSAEHKGLQGTAKMACVDGEWCETPVSPRWWDNVAKTDVIGMRELQR